VGEGLVVVIHGEDDRTCPFHAVTVPAPAQAEGFAVT
jgi:hypothetical protein